MSFMAWLSGFFHGRPPVTAASVALPEQLEFVGAAKPMPDGAYEAAALDLSVPVAAIRAVAEVETSHDAFYDDCRPAILYEAATFHELTGGRHAGARDRNGVLLDSPSWDRTLYGADGAHQYERLADAMRLDRKAALQATSWGMFQVMGENAEICGYTDVETFVTAMCQGEAQHLDAFKGFVRSRGLIMALRAKNWTLFAAHYNGSGQVSEYAGRIAKAYAKWSNA